VSRTKHKMRATIPHGDPDIGAEVDVEITFTYLPGAAPIIYPADNADPGYPAEIGFVGVSPISNGKPFAYYGAFADLEQEALENLARDWLEGDDGLAEAFAVVRDDDEAAREYHAELRRDA
jgi:hypothetical protein